MKTRNFYTQNGWQGSNYDRNLSIKDIAAKIREFVKKEFPECKFSITKAGSSFTDYINITLMEAPQNVFSEPINNNKLVYCGKNDGRLNEYGKKILEKVNIFSLSYNYDDSDSMIDYFDTRFYLVINVGKWDKPFKVVETKEKKIYKAATTKQAYNIKLVEYSEKAFAIIGDTKALKEQLKELGGRFNFNLTCGAGWIFSKKQENSVKLALGL